VRLKKQGAIYFDQDGIEVDVKVDKGGRPRFKGKWVGVDSPVEKAALTYYSESVSGDSGPELPPDIFTGDSPGGMVDGQTALEQIRAKLNGRMLPDGHGLFMTREGQSVEDSDYIKANEINDMLYNNKPAPRGFIGFMSRSAYEKAIETL